MMTISCTAILNTHIFVGATQKHISHTPHFDRKIHNVLQIYPCIAVGKCITFHTLIQCLYMPVVNVYVISYSHVCARKLYITEWIVGLVSIEK